MMKTKEEVIQLFKNAYKNKKVELYNKFGNVLARNAIPGEQIVTIIDDKIETSNYAKQNDVVVKNIASESQEQYIINKDKFLSRYKLDELTFNFSLAEPTGKCYAFRYLGENFTFEAPWGEMMVVENGDMIAVTSLSDLNDIYRIEKNAFLKTYMKQENE